MANASTLSGPPPEWPLHSGAAYRASSAAPMTLLGQQGRQLPQDLRDRHAATVRAMNCHRVAAFRPGAEGMATYAKFTSMRSQVLNQSPEFRDC